MRNKLAAATSRIEDYKNKGMKIVATSGCFDLLHAGHVQSLEEAKACGDILIVFLNSDVSVRQLKGRGRPIISQVDREYLLLSLSCIDEVIVFDEVDCSMLIYQIQPDIFFKGGDYSAVPSPEKLALESYGGSQNIGQKRDTLSTSEIVRKIVSSRFRTGVFL